MSETDAIKRALARERLARKEAERILEEKSRQLFDSNQLLQELNTSLENQVKERTVEINKNAEQLEILFEKNPVPILIYRLEDFQFISVNQTAVDNYGHSKEEFLAMKISDLYPKDGFTPLEAHLDTVRSDVSEIVEWKHVTKKGDLIDVEISSAPITFYGVSSWMVLIKDITEQKAAYRAREENERKYKELVESASDIIYRCDENGFFIYVNPTGEHVSGFSNSQLMKMKFTQLVREDHRERLEQFYAEQLSNQVQSSYTEFPIVTKDGEEKWLGQTVDLNFQKMRSGHPEFSALSRDITQRKKIEGELLIAKETAESSVRSKEIFMANMSHEIRTPMNAIIGMSEILSKSELGTKQVGYVDAIRKSADNMLIIINDILDFSKIEAGKLDLSYTTVDIQKLLKDSASLMDLKVEEKGLIMDVALDPGLRSYSADPTRLGQVIINLLSNAVKFTESGVISLKCAILETSSQRDTMLFSVKDTGIGVEASKLERIFESFIQAEESTTRKYGGTGLGLPISRQLVKMMGGELEIRSELGVGTEFFFTISLDKAEPTAMTEIDRTTDASSLKGTSVLLVEDNEINRFMAQTILENWECEVSIAVHGQEAVEMLSDSDYDIVLMDMRMPVMDGMEATRSIRKELKSSVPIIGLTANALKGDKEKCLEIGMDDYVTKPFKQEELQRKMIQQIGNDLQSEPTAVISAPNETQGLVDLSMLEQSTNGDKEFMKKMILLFLDDVPSRIDAIKEALDANDPVAIGKIAHGMKPSIDHLAIDPLKESVRELEDAQLSDEAFRRKVNGFIDKINTLISELKAHI